MSRRRRWSTASITRTIAFSCAVSIDGLMLRFAIIVLNALVSSSSNSFTTFDSDTATLSGLPSPSSVSTERMSWLSAS